MWIPDPIYRQILEVMPIPCVDIVVRNPAGEVLLLMRENEPDKGKWWFPGGRIHYGEKRLDAAHRKLHEECGIKTVQFKEIGTFDVLLPLPGCRSSHAVTTVYETNIKTDRAIELDKQSSSCTWHQVSGCISTNTHSLFLECLRRACHNLPC